MTKLTKQQARRIIIDAANSYRAPWAAKPYTMRSVQRAACAARRLRLVDRDVLVAAGYRPSRVVIRQPTQAVRDRNRAKRLAERAAKRANKETA